jgi:cyclohexyl-isocyanide hydratase
MTEPRPLSIAFLLYPEVTQLDLTGPAQFLSRIGGTLHYVAKSAEPVPTDAGFSILPTATFADVSCADIICVPGGISCVDVIEDDETLAWVRRVGEGAEWVTSVCTGSLILGAAGLLRGYRAGCHWAWREHLALFGAEPVAERVVFDRNRVTGGGVTAGIDFALALIAAVRGEQHARLIQLALEYDPAPPFDSGSPVRAAPDLVAFYHRRMEAIAPGRGERIRAAAGRQSAAAE